MNFLKESLESFFIYSNKFYKTEKLLYNKEFFNDKHVIFKCVKDISFSLKSIHNMKFSLQKFSFIDNVVFEVCF